MEWLGGIASRFLLVRYEFKPLVLSHGMEGKRGTKVDA